MAADDFSAACRRVVRALRAADWESFRKVAADEIVFERIERIYLQEFSPEAAKLLTGPGWINDDYLRGKETEPANGNDRDEVIFHRVSMTGMPSADELRAFRSYSEFVRKAYFVRQGRNLHAEEVQSLWGPAIEVERSRAISKWRRTRTGLPAHGACAS